MFLSCQFFMMALFVTVAKRGQTRTLVHHFFSSSSSRSVSLLPRRQAFMTLSAVNDHLTDIATKVIRKRRSSSSSSSSGMTDTTETIVESLPPPATTYGLTASTAYESEQPYLDRLRQTDSKVTPYWVEQLSNMERPTARGLIRQLVPDNPLGFNEVLSDPTKNSKKQFLDFILKQKKSHPDKVILVRNGEFYETVGVDALMMIAHSGLNPMGGKAKAGCPAKNVQAALDGLTGAGLTVAVYEEVVDVNVSQGPASKKGIKHRQITQVNPPLVLY